MKIEEEIQNFNNDLFEIVQANIVYGWAMNGFSEICSICHSGLTSFCSTCEEKEELGDVVDECKICIGECDHMFHSHCINRWKCTRSTCPLDSTLFVLKKHLTREEICRKYNSN